MIEWIEAVIAEIRLHAEAALLRRLDVGAGDPRSPSHIFLRDPAAQARIAGGTLRPQGSHRQANEAVAAAIDAASERSAKLVAPKQSRFAQMLQRLAIDATASGLVATSLAYALDLDTRELVHALAPRRKPALYLETCADLLALSPYEVLQAIAPLRRARVVHADGDGLDASIELAQPVLAWLLGDDALQPPLAELCELVTLELESTVVLPPPVAKAVDDVVSKANAQIAVVLRGPRGSGRRAAAFRLAKKLHKPMLVIPIPAMPHKQMLGLALAAARIRDALPFLQDADALYDEGGNLAAEHADAIAAFPNAIAVASTGRGGHLDLRRPSLVVPMPRTDLDDREKAWAHALTVAKGPVAEAPLLAARYVIGPGAIAETVAEASRHAKAANVGFDLDVLEGAVGRRLSLRLGTFGSVVSRKALMSELVLPDDVIDTLRDMIAMVRERSQILERWGYQRHLGISRGVAGLYSGEPGTGKTMAASVVASELGLELVRIDLSAVVSKYVGETEKNLGKIFDEAQDAHAMLLFDEADSLFGKRTELKSAQDRFANLEVNYILQRMETFDGVSVLTTNAESAIDPALQRRLNFRIRFPEPEVEEREKLWAQLLPPLTGLTTIDFNALAERFDMTGGYIKNAVVRAAVIAARAGRAMIAEDLWTGAHHEYVEMGKVMPTP
jgi:ATPase family associated with various cellular activities (AAA)